MNEVKVITSVLLQVWHRACGAVEKLLGRGDSSNIICAIGGLAVLDLHFQCGNVMKVDSLLLS